MSDNGKGKATKAGAQRAFDILLPRLNRAEAGDVFVAGSYVRRSGVVPPALQAARLQGGSIGVHAAAAGASHSLCGCALTSETKAAAAREYAACKAAGKAGSALTRVAEAVTCKFCQARLIAAGVLAADAPHVHSYAADYGTRGDVSEQLAAIDARAKAAADAVAKAAAKAAAAARKAAKAAAAADAGTKAAA